MNLNQLLSSFSKNTLAFLAISGGILFIVLSQPPHSICDSQLTVIRDSQKHFLYKDPPKSKVIKTTKYETQRDRCRSTNSPGGCYELFHNTKILLEDLNSLTNECGTPAAGIPEVKRALWETVELLTELAWGEKPPVSYNAKYGWLDTADVTLFCKLKTRVVFVFGENSWVSFRERMMQELPGAKTLTRNQVWDMSLFSENCARYP